MFNLPSSNAVMISLADTGVWSPRKKNCMIYSSSIHFLIHETNSKRKLKSIYHREKLSTETKVALFGLKSVKLHYYGIIFKKDYFYKFLNIFEIHIIEIFYIHVCLILI